ncbi:MAG: D-alanyl-D-alanine carboxypeptidase family protein [Gammaproteobacteria bacterium]
MKIKAAIVLFLLTLLSTASHAAGPPIPAPPAIDARAYVLLDYQTGAILAQQNMDERLEPASLTKIMTIYTVAAELKGGHASLDDEVLVSENAWRTQGSRMFIEVGKRVRLEDLMKGDIIQSGNDASVAMAEHVSGSEQVFAELMNQNAKSLGMNGTHFTNSTGLPDPEHYTTAHDLARLSTALIRNYPDVYKWFAFKEFVWNGIRQQNRNRLLFSDASVDGIKTGFTDNAGYCLAASAVRDGRRLIAVVMGTPEQKVRAAAAAALLGYGFKFTETRRLYAAREPVTRVKVWKGAVDTLGLGVAADAVVTVGRGRIQDLDAHVDVQSPVLAPVAAGQALGTLTVKLDGQEIIKRPLVAVETVEQSGLFGRLADTVRLWFE